MITISENVINKIKSPVRQIKARAELYNSSALLQDVFSDSDKLISFTVERVGDESKFFGFGVCQKINIKLIDINRELNITTDNYFKVIYTVEDEDIIALPLFYVTEVNRDENTNELSITAYDILNEASAHYSAELALFENPEEEATVIDDVAEFTITNYISACADVLGLDNVILCSSGEWENIIYTDTAEINLEGTETIREILDALAEITHSIYFINHENKIEFKSYNYNGIGNLAIGKDMYFTLSSIENRKLTNIVHTTELGENLAVNTGAIGSTQYIRDNPFISLNTDNTTLILNDILTALGDLTINQFELSWRGYPALEIGDKLDITTKDNATISAYVINDTISYNGAFSETTSWRYEDNTEETESNPTTLGEALKQTFAKVDKVNKEITILASKAEDNEEALAELKLTTDGIITTVTNNQKAVSDLSDNYNTIYNQVEAKITASDVDLKITEALESGVNSVSTTTGFTFNSDGLNISKSDSEISTLINEDGMRVSKDNTEVLTANNTGVNAINLTANQYLIIGDFSRFENYGSNRTGCFWIGG